MGKDDNEGRSIPATNLTNYTNIIKKTVENSDGKNNENIDNTDLFSSVPISSYSSDVISKNQDILDLFPDIELAIKIRIAAILSPNNMDDEEVKIRLKENNSATSLVNSQIATTVKSFISNKLDLEKMIMEARFTKGAYISAIIPEPLLDKIINNAVVGVENENIDSSRLTKKEREIKRDNFSFGIFKTESLNSKEFMTGMESDLNVSIKEDKRDNLEKAFKLDDLISDNFFAIKSITSALESANDLIKQKLKVLKTPSNKLTDADINSVFSKLKKNREEFMVLPAVSSSSSRGSALEIKLPVSSCIPIYPNGEPSNHIGYFILTNPLTGTPIQDDEFTKRKETYNRTFNGALNSGSSSAVQTVLDSIQGPSISKDSPKIVELDKIYNKLLDFKIKSVLKDSLYGDIVDIDITSNEAYRVMLSRVLESKQTKMIFIPKELVSYITFEHRENGTGKSILEKLDFFANARATVFFTNLMAKVSNSMSNTLVNAEIDENHPNPKQARAHVMSEFLRTRGSLYPSNMLKFNELEEWAKYAGIQFNIKHSQFGNTEIEITESEIQKKEIDTELEDVINNYIYYTIGVTKDQIESARSEDFAIAVASRNKMNAKRTKTEQNIFCPQVSELIQRMVRYDSVTYEQVRNIVKENYTDLKDKFLESEIGEEQAEEENKNEEGAIDLITDSLIDDIEFFLPKPEVTDDTTTATQFTNFKDNLSAVLESLLTDDSITEATFGELNASKDDIVKIIKFSATLDYLRNNNHMNYLVDMFTLDKEEKALVNPIDEYFTMIKAIGGSILDAKEKIGKEGMKITFKNTKLEEKLTPPEDNVEGGDEGDNFGGEEETNPVGGEEEVAPGGEETNTEETGAPIEEATPSETGTEETAPPEEITETPEGTEKENTGNEDEAVGMPKEFPKDENDDHADDLGKTKGEDDEEDFKL